MITVIEPGLEKVENCRNVYGYLIGGKRLQSRKTP